MTAGPRRIGMFGGAFDPPHNAHVALVQAAVAQLQLDELRVVPTGHAWHKPRVLTPASDRLAMVRLAFAGLPGVVVVTARVSMSSRPPCASAPLSRASSTSSARVRVIPG